MHPKFPVSILASISAGIGEEIIFRGFVFGLWGLILNWLFKQFKGRAVALWIANSIAAIAFGAGHLGTVMFLTGASSPAALDPVLLFEVFLLNGIIGLVAGERYMKDGLVAAAGRPLLGGCGLSRLLGLGSLTCPLASQNSLNNMYHGDKVA